MDRIKSFILSDSRHWGHEMELLFACLAICFDTGSIMWFPYMCYRYGGIVYMAAYTIWMVVLGIPLILMELYLGQYIAKGAVGAWDICPLFRGVGMTFVWTTTLSVFAHWYSTGTTLVYFFYTFISDLPWYRCDNAWNTPSCTDYQLEYDDDFTLNDTDANYDTYFTNSTYLGTFQRSPAHEFFNHFVLSRSDGIYEFGGMNWKLTISVLCIALLLFVCLFMGVKIFGKIFYATATLPFILLFMLFVRFVSLPGAGTGLKFMFYPELRQIFYPSMWYRAATSVLYRCGIGFGVFTTLGSYNRVQTNNLKYAIVSAAVLWITPIVCGFVVFSMFGFLANDLGVAIYSVVTGGLGMLFIAFPDAILKIPGSSFWSGVLILLIFLTQINACIILLEVSIKGISEMLPQKFRPPRVIMTFAVILLLLVIMLPMFTYAGGYVMNVVDYNCISGVLWACFFEVIAIANIYGARRLLNNIQEMTGYHHNRAFWTIYWRFITPIICGLLMLYGWIMYRPVRWYAEYSYPLAIRAYGAQIYLAGLLIIPVYALFYIAGKPGSTLRKQLSESVKPLLSQNTTMKSGAEELQPFSPNQATGGEAYMGQPQGENV